MKKTLSLILTFAMLLSVFAGALPAYAIGHAVRTESLVLGDESKSSEAEGWSYDASTHTLVLNNVTIDCSAQENGNCITAQGDLNIVLEGESTLISKTVESIDAMCSAVKFNGDLAFSGSGILDINEGNFAVQQTSSDNTLTINSGTINITHDFDSYTFDAENSTAMLLANMSVNTTVNGGVINSDAMFFAKEINGGTINSCGVVNKAVMTINDGTVNTGMLYATDLTVNGGTVTATGGAATTQVNDYMSEHDEEGILSTCSFEMNGGEVHTYGSLVGICVLGECSFNGGSFTAESEGAAFLAQTGDKEANINMAKAVEIEEPASYSILSFDGDNPAPISGDSQQDIQFKTIFDSTTENPFFEIIDGGGFVNFKVSTNAAKKVVINERDFPDNIVLDRDGGSWDDCFEAQGADDLGDGVYSKLSKGWRYDTNTNTLYLNNTTIDCSSDESNGNCIYAADDLNLVLEGESTLISKTNISTGGWYVPIFLKGNLTVSGTGTLNIEEGNYSFRFSNQESKFEINSGTINISHNFDSYEADENSTGFVMSNTFPNTVINGGEINCDVLFMAKEIKNCKINAHGLICKQYMFIHSSEVNVDTLVGMGIHITDSTVNVAGGGTDVLVKDYLTANDKYGIISAGEFSVAQVSDVYTHGSEVGFFTTSKCYFVSSSFIAESEGVAFVTSDLNDSDIMSFPCNWMRMEEPESYSLLAVEVAQPDPISVEVSGTDFNETNTETNTYKAIFDSSVEEPYIVFNDDGSVSTNAAKKVVIKEYWDYSLEADVEALDFGSVCVDEDYPEAQTVTITNIGNRAFDYLNSSSENFTLTYKPNTIVDSGKSLAIKVEPNENLPVGVYNEIITFSTTHNTSVTVPVTFTVTEHSFGEYASNNDATYDEDGTKTRVCENCGKEETVADEGSKLIRNGWFDEEIGRRYYVDGEALTGWVKDSDKWYYLDSNGIMQTGWLKDGGKWYFLSKSGAMRTGWVKSEGKWYYLNSHGAMTTGWQKVNSTWYYMNSHGAMQTGWVKVTGKWYYLEKSGAMRTADLTYKGKVYKFNSSGACINP